MTTDEDADPREFSPAGKWTVQGWPIDVNIRIGDYAMIFFTGKKVMSGLAALAAAGVIMAGSPQQVEADEWDAYAVVAVQQVPAVIANDSSQTIVQLLVRNQDEDHAFYPGPVLNWEEIERGGSRAGLNIIRNLEPGQWAQYSLVKKSEMAGPCAQPKRMYDVKVTLADGSVLEVDNVELLSQDVVLTDSGLKVVDVHKVSAQSPDMVQASGYFNAHSPRNVRYK